MLELTKEQEVKAFETLKRVTKRIHEKQIIREALEEIHDRDSEYQKERNELDKEYHAKLIKLEQKYLGKYNEVG